MSRRFHPVIIVLPVIAAQIICGACGQTDGPDESYTVRDSAGIEIVENAGGGLWTPDEGWRLSELAAVEIGSIAGDAALFRVHDVVRLSDGRIVVANSGTSELRFFSAEGLYLFAVGGAGGGPGEFRVLTALASGTADTILAYDAWSGRVSIFGPAGAFVRSIQIGLPVAGFAPMLDLIGWLESRTFVAATSRVDEDIRGPPDGGGPLYYRPTVTLLLYDARGVRVHTLGRFRGDESVTNITTPASGQLKLQTFPMPFLKTFEAAASGRLVAAGSTDVYEIRIYGTDGTLQRIVRMRTQGQVVTPKDVGAWVDHQTSRIEDATTRRRHRRVYERLQFPGRMPAFESLLLDSTGQLWVREHVEPAADSDSVQWSVFDRGGRLLGTVWMPRRFRPCEIGENFVLGIWEDTLDVERIRMYELIKHAGRAR